MLKEVDENSFLYKMRHSLSHVLAQAVQEYRPGTKLGFGPPIHNGFYYDFLLPEPITPDDLPKIEKIMRRIIKSKQEFSYEELPASEALERIASEMKEPHKLEYAQELITKHELETLTFYRNGPFLDMCEGPHVENTSKLPQDGFSLDSIASAYWRGDEKNVQLTRIYALAFTNRKELKAYKQKKEEALKNDHRKLGLEFDLFHIDDEVGKGLPLWLPNGTILRDELEKLAAELEFKDGYKKVATPHITKEALYYTSGHLPFYEEGMYPPMVLEETRLNEEGQEENHQERYFLKPMNCPHHHKIFGSRPRSYRDLPLRFTEYGTVYRFERSGALQGLTRVRGMTMNDAHIYCTKEQIKEEFIRVMELHKKLYDIFGFKDYYFRLSMRDKENTKGKYVENEEAWDYSERLIKEAMDEFGAPYRVEEGEAAFYGPKVDIQFLTVADREFTVSTNQLDFAVPPRFNLKYIGADNQEHTPFCIHRAPLGTHERFIAFLIEHYGGAFPTWLAPVQVKVIPISEKFADYAKKVEEELLGDMVRAEIDNSSETFNKKVRTNTVRRIPILLIIGEREMLEETVTVRRYKIKQQKTMPFSEFRTMLASEIKERRHVLEW
ncbi:threonine--tRNA ligase [Acanthopleuribacter pedis]|uniref:Threonine--tRNA ligase n=1 Tax=Acanthopleuribacter pedis TaxID=442870 RepID=A0A8J7Q0H2_9BACT|nr:threonine--tRNA ligase [Acanthopleuribacter pedis]MBO1316980.1 threonine--tRNA ligase [Acanthopleuribacter pedis]